MTRHDRGTPRGADLEPLPMPMEAVQEMVSDWMGASHTYDNRPVEINNWPWLDRTWPIKIKRMHGDTKNRAMQVLFKLGRNYLCP